MDKEDFGVYGPPDSTFGAPDMASGDMRLTDSDTTTAASHFHPGTGMDSGGAAATVSISVWMMRHPLFVDFDTCH